MAKNVPLWVAIVSAGVGISLGSVNLIEKGWSYFHPEQPKISQRFLIFSIPLDDTKSAPKVLLKAMAEFDTLAYAKTEALIKKLDFSFAQNEVKNICQADPELKKTKCTLMYMHVAFMGLRNDGAIPLSSYALKYDRYENQAGYHTPNDGLAIIPYKYEDKMDPECFKDSGYDRTEECFSTRVERGLKFSGSQPIIKGETLLIPLYFGYTIASSDKDGDNHEVDRIEKSFFFPTNIEINGEFSFPARVMSVTPTIRANAVEERG